MKQLFLKIWNNLQRNTCSRFLGLGLQLYYLLYIYFVISKITQNFIEILTFVTKSCS